MPSSRQEQPWKRQLLGLAAAAILGVSSALPAELAATDATISAPDSIQASSRLAPEITEARVSEVKTSSSGRIGTSCVSLPALAASSSVSRL